MFIRFANALSSIISRQERDPDFRKLYCSPSRRTSTLRRNPLDDTRISHRISVSDADREDVQMSVCATPLHLDSSVNTPRRSFGFKTTLICVASFLIAMVIALSIVSASPVDLLDTPITSSLHSGLTMGINQSRSTKTDFRVTVIFPTADFLSAGHAPSSTFRFSSLVRIENVNPTLSIWTTSATFYDQDDFYDQPMSFFGWNSPHWTTVLISEPTSFTYVIASVFQLFRFSGLERSWLFIGHSKFSDDTSHSGHPLTRLLKSRILPSQEHHLLTHRSHKSTLDKWILVSVCSGPLLQSSTMVYDIAAGVVNRFTDNDHLQRLATYLRTRQAELDAADTAGQNDVIEAILLSGVISVQNDLRTEDAQALAQLRTELQAARAAATAAATPAPAARRPVVASPLQTQATLGAAYNATRWQGCQVVSLRSSRSTMTADELQSLATSIGTGVKNGYRQVRLDDILRVKDPKSDSDTVIDVTSTIVDVTNRLQAKLAKYGADAVFKVYTYMADNETPVSETSLFTSFGSVSEADLRLTIINLHTKTPDTTFSQDLFWSLDSVYNSIDDANTRRLVEDLILKEPPEYQVGPLALFHLFHIICAVDERTLIAIRIQLHTTFGFSSVKDYDVDVLAMTYQQVHQFLEMYGVNMSDSNLAFKRILSTCPVEAFRQHFATLTSTNDTRLATLDSTIKEARVHYNMMRVEGTYNPPVTKKQGAAFLGRVGPDRDIPDDVSVLSYNTSTPMGRDGRPLPAHDKGGLPIDYNAPKSGSAWKRKCPTTGRNQFWCPTCGRWGNHGGKDADDLKHDAWAKQQKERRKRQKERRKPKDQEPSTPSPSGATPSGPAPTASSATPPPTIARGLFTAMTISGAADHF